MTYTLKIRTKAAKQIDEAFYWYENKRVGLGDDFMNEIDKCFSSLTVNPFLHSELYENNRFRKVLVSKFPYSIIYEVKKNAVSVYTVVHHKRRKRI